MKKLVLMYANYLGQSYLLYHAIAISFKLEFYNLPGAKVVKKALGLLKRATGLLPGITRRILILNFNLLLGQNRQNQRRFQSVNFFCCLHLNLGAKLKKSKTVSK